MSDFMTTSGMLVCLCVLPPFSLSLQPDAPEPMKVDWQLGNWIRSCQLNSGTQGPRSSHPSPSSTDKQPGPLQTSTHTTVEVAEHKSRKRSLECDETSQDCPKRQNLQTPPPAGQSDCIENSLSGAAEATLADTALPLMHGDTEAPKKQTHSLNGHKAKTKKKHHKRSKKKVEDKRDGSRSSKDKAHKKDKAAAAEPKVAAVLQGGCSSCGVQHPNPCTCPTQPGQLPLSCRPQVQCSKPKSKSPHRTAQKQRTKTGQDTQRSQDANHWPPGPLTVKIALGLLARIPKNSGKNPRQEGARKAKRSKAEQQDPCGAGSKASLAQNPTNRRRKTKRSHVRDPEGLRS